MWPILGASWRQADQHFFRASCCKNSKHCFKRQTGDWSSFLCTDFARNKYIGWFSLVGIENWESNALSIYWWNQCNDLHFWPHPRSKWNHQQKTHTHRPFVCHVSRIPLFETRNPRSHPLHEKQMAQNPRFIAWPPEAHKGTFFPCIMVLLTVGYQFHGNHGQCLQSQMRCLLLALLLLQKAIESMCSNAFWIRFWMEIDHFCWGRWRRN